jgi:hypothetical protein
MKKSKLTQITFLAVVAMAQNSFASPLKEVICENSSAYQGVFKMVPSVVGVEPELGWSLSGLRSVSYTNNFRQEGEVSLNPYGIPITGINPSTYTIVEDPISNFVLVFSDRKFSSLQKVVIKNKSDQILGELACKRTVIDYDDPDCMYMKGLPICCPKDSENCGW